MKSQGAHLPKRGRTKGETIFGRFGPSDCGTVEHAFARGAVVREAALGSSDWCRETEWPSWKCAKETSPMEMAASVESALRFVCSVTF